MLYQIVLDADGKPSSGILRGGTIWPGHFDECNSVYAPKDSSGHGGFSGQYCTTSWSFNLGGKVSNFNYRNIILDYIHYLKNFKIVLGVEIKGITVVEQIMID